MTKEYHKCPTLWEGSCILPQALLAWKTCRWKTHEHVLSQRQRRRRKGSKQWHQVILVDSEGGREILEVQSAGRNEVVDVGSQDGGVDLEVGPAAVRRWEEVVLWVVDDGLKSLAGIFNRPSLRVNVIILFSLPPVNKLVGLSLSSWARPLTPLRKPSALVTNKNDIRLKILPRNSSLF